MNQNAQRYRTSSWERARTAHRRCKADFAAHLRRIAAPMQIAYQRLMSAHNGLPVGIECRMGSRASWAFVVSEMSSAEKWRVQYFDEGGFVGHGCYASIKEAVESMMRDGYRTPDPGALDRTASTPRWAVGMKRSAIRQRCQEGLITFPQMIEEMEAIPEAA
ncbi:hypothetical protein [Paraburkholderia sp. SIMBA_054]|uniref:hypothetical protein n=1 Tax=Paraburkholderia sp. SIMBA_054 TaxID=3085795 RepID=UPI00397D08AA